MMQNNGLRVSEQVLAEQINDPREKGRLKSAGKRPAINIVLRDWNIPGSIESTASRSYIKIPATI